MRSLVIIPYLTTGVYSLPGASYSRLGTSKMLTQQLLSGDLNWRASSGQPTVVTKPKRGDYRDWSGASARPKVHRSGAPAAGGVTRWSQAGGANSWVKLGKRKGLAVPASANPSSLLVAGARNHLQANRSLGFCFEIAI